MLPEDINSFTCTSKMDPDTIGFFGELNPLSNFHYCPFTYQDVEYHSSEQMIQHQKALHYKDHVSAKKIMYASTAFECKQISNDISPPDEDVPKWIKVPKAKCTGGLTAQIHTKPNLVANPGKHRDRTIMESSYDKLWGTGVSLYNEDCLKPFS